MHPADLGPLALVIACAEKLAPSYAAARVSGLGRDDARIVVVLLNTLGLTEHIALNAGLQADLITPEVFTVFTLMALLTTIAASPLLVPTLRRNPASVPVLARDLAGQPDQEQEAERGDRAER